MDYIKICQQALEVVENTGIFIRKERENFSQTSIEYKGTNDLVSYVDKNAEIRLVEGLSKILPNAGFITEENTAKDSGEDFIWIIDPLDGTTNFIHGLPPYSISVALYNNKKPVVGIVLEVFSNERFYTALGSKAFLNGKEIRVSGVKTIQESLLITGFPYRVAVIIDKIQQGIEYFVKNSHGIRRLGSAAADLAYVACGRSEGFYETGLSPWDSAAGAFLVQQAGGKASDFKGGDNYIFGSEIVVSNGLIHNELQHILHNIMYPGDKL